MITLLNIDCMEYMAYLPDKAFDLAIVDPPYGIGFDNKIRDKKTKNWDDSIPNNSFFLELKRVSDNQIIWGGNYFSCLWDNGCKGFIFWHKDSTVGNFSDGELAWTSFNKVAKCFFYAWNGLADGVVGRNKKEKNIHPTQKPVKLYDWLLQNYAKPGQRILDTHLGSGSSAIAAHYFGVEFVGCELDEDYYKAAVDRFKHATAQESIFDIE